MLPLVAMGLTGLANAGKNANLLSGRRGPVSFIFFHPKPEPYGHCCEQEPLNKNTEEVAPFRAVLPKYVHAHNSCRQIWDNEQDNKRGIVHVRRSTMVYWRIYSQSQPTYRGNDCRSHKRPQQRFLNIAFHYPISD
jgi:hypothetical protein